MISYLLVCYLVMFVWTIKWFLFDYEDGLLCFKLWVLSPITAPWFMFVKFAEWQL